MEPHRNQETNPALQSGVPARPNAKCCMQTTRATRSAEAEEGTRTRCARCARCKGAAIPATLFGELERCPGAAKIVCSCEPTRVARSAGCECRGEGTGSPARYYSSSDDTRQSSQTNCQTFQQPPPPRRRGAFSSELMKAGATRSAGSGRTFAPVTVHVLPCCRPMPVASCLIIFHPILHEVAYCVPYTARQSIRHPKLREKCSKSRPDWSTATQVLFYNCRVFSTAQYCLSRNTVASRKSKPGRTKPTNIRSICATYLLQY
jgi:hypothetical protein